ncbi:nucleolar MIF4G domain-containing protein 1 homolog [Stomoxys calcitrans]|uniref:nucleolar MIF4G domain-containing protein 1 homolog n=1 Tax=Stomoxys calcitrans TaxID=35570 RepID=UPI0027E39C36|nr:nucleolar MIF4G domain-containing protein 1 homolog [Stomoxys calcitrans]
MTKIRKGKLKQKHAAPANLTRKELRKQKSQQKKENKRLFFSSKTEGKNMVAQARKEKDIKLKTSIKKKNKKTKVAIDPKDMPLEQLLSGEVDSDNNESLASDFSDVEVDALLPATLKVKKVAVQNKPSPAIKKAKSQTSNRPNVEEQHRRELLRQKDLENASRKQRVKQLKLENEEEDKIIAKLEKKLGLNKTKNKNRMARKMFNDGLDFALELCLDDGEEEEKQLLKEKRKQELKEQQKEPSWSDEEQDEERFNAIFGSGGESEAGSEEEEGGELEQSEDDLNDDDGEDQGSEGKNDSDNGDDDKVEQGDASKKDEEYKEDIYGRKRDKDGNIIKENNEGPQKYIPPHQRALLAAKNDDRQAEILERLRKQCKGLLNRLSEANLHKISAGIEELYMKNSRFNMNETLNKLLQEVLISQVMSNERMVQEHMVLLAYLHAHIGSEIGAHFLQTFIELFDAFLKDVEQLLQEDKRLNNVVLLLSYMYVFKIFEHRLLLEIIDRLSNQLNEKTIECLLLIFQSVGFKLRKDDPLAFKQMMLSVQSKIAAAPLELKENLRLKFMVDILNAVKNNNINKIPRFDPELHENLRKKLKAMLRNDKYVITLNITMEDLLRADTVGKWWVVGSAWTGNISEMAAAQKKQQNGEAVVKSERFSEQLLKLAKQHKMNTEERRNIFCVIMSAADYIDAFEKILHLAVKDLRSIAYVIIHCCLNEKASNPYYAHLALKFCNYNRKYQLAFQFASWDRINEIDSLNKIQVRNLARFLQHLILNNGLQLSVLKIIDFLQIDKQSFALMKEICKGLLLAAEEQDMYQAFERLAKNSKLQQFKQSIRLFLQHFMLKEQGTTLKLSDDQMELLRRRVEYVDKLLAYVEL